MKNLKGRLSGLVTILLLVGISLVGFETVCSAQAPIRLKAAFWVYPQSAFAVGQDWYMKEVEFLTKGKVIFERYWSQSLVTARDIPDALAGGIADVGTILPGYYAGKFPLGDVGSMPGLNYHQWPCLTALQETWNHAPELREEFARRGVRMLTPIAFGPYNLWTKKEVKSLEDLKGLKIRSVGIQALLIKALGATPVAITPPELYDALQKGTVDGAVGDYDVAVAYGWHKVTNYYNMVPVGTSTCYFAISNKTWNGLPADIQKIMQDVVPDAIKAYAEIYEIDGISKWRKIALGAGIKEVPFPRDQANKVKEIAKTQVWDKWATEMQSKGFAGQKVLETYVKAIEKYIPLDPMKYE